jgi:hypothetical protein
MVMIDHGEVGTLQIGSGELASKIKILKLVDVGKSIWI